MASVMLCDGGHEEPTVGSVLTQWMETGEANVWCPACYEVFLWAAVEALPTFDDRVKGYMNAIMDKDANRRSNAARRRRKAGEPETDEESKDSPDEGAESTATQE